MKWYKPETSEFWFYEGPPFIELKYGLIRVHYENCIESLSSEGFEILCHGKRRPMYLEEIIEHRNTVTGALSKLNMEDMFSYQLWNDYAKCFNNQINNFFEDKKEAKNLMIEYKRTAQ